MIAWLEMMQPPSIRDLMFGARVARERKKLGDSPSQLFRASVSNVLTEESGHRAAAEEEVLVHAMSERSKWLNVSVLTMLLSFLEL